MALSNHQINILKTIYEGCCDAALYNVTEGQVNQWLKAKDVSTIGRKYLNIYFLPQHLVYDFEFMMDATWDEVLEKVQNDTATMPKRTRKRRSNDEDAAKVDEINNQGWNAEPIIAPAPVVEPPKPSQSTVNIAAGHTIGFYIPSKDSRFVAFGPMETLQTIINANTFLPTYIYGDTGIAKSMSVVQACAKANRELFRVNVNINTDEEDFIGGFRLVNNETVFEKGPLVLAMERGAILLIDEISALNPANAFALFSVLEGNELYIKKTNERVKPAEGFNIIVTDNTKGKGSTSGRFVGTNVQNDALLDRFVVSLEYTYPTPAQELKILNRINDTNKELNKNLIKWANIVRTTFADGIIDETISVRKLCSILEINAVFNDIKKSIELALNRYEVETKQSIIDLFEKVVIDPLYGNVDFESIPEGSSEGSSEGSEKSPEGSADAPSDSLEL